jgi:hypothetical protein
VDNTLVGPFQESRGAITVETARFGSHRQNDFLIERNVIARVGKGRNLALDYAPTGFIAEGNTFDPDAGFRWDNPRHWELIPFGVWRKVTGQDRRSRTRVPDFLIPTDGKAKADPDNDSVRELQIDLDLLLERLAPAYLNRGVRYRNEVWTGIEYQVAGGMIWEGKVDQGLAICRGIHERYHPGRHNPFNEVECGDHYARALASWGVYHALLGYDYHGPRQYIGFAPRLRQEDFAAAFTASEGWGLFRQSRTAARQENRIQIRHGRLLVRSLCLPVPAGSTAEEIEVVLGDRPVPVEGKQTMSRLLLEFDSLTLTEGQELRVAFELTR